MRKIMVSIFVILTMTNFGQNYSLSHLNDILSQDACNCINKNSFTDFFDKKIESICLDQIFLKNQDLVIKTILTVFGDTSEVAAQKAGYAIHNMVTSNLIKVCNKYYNLLVASRERYFSKISRYNKDSIRAVINSSKMKSKDLRDADYFKIRAVNYFYIGDIANAKQDLDTVEIFESNSLFALYQRAEIAEYSEDFDNGIEYYNEFAMRIKNSTFQLFALMLERKKNGYINQIKAQQVKTKDGVIIGNRIEAINSCIKGANNALINYQGMQINSKTYCSCVVDQLIPNVTNSELTNALKNKRIMDLISDNKNFDIINKCLQGNFVVDSSTVLDNQDSATLYPIAIKNCTNEIMRNKGTKNITAQYAKEYCECAIPKLYSNGYTYKQLGNMNDLLNSDIYYELIAPCIEEISKRHQDTEVNKNTAEIKGPSIGSLKLYEYGGRGYKLKIIIDGIEKYYLLDTGSDYLTIDQNMEEQLLEKGNIENNTPEYKQVQLADKSIVLAKIVTIRNIKFGPFEINNAKAAVLKNGALLWGKGFLDIFSRWNIDSKEKLLLLNK